MKCPRCQQENPAHARFCLGCGARLALACTSCGTELPGGARFCLQCGQAVAAGSAAASPSRAPEAYTPKHLAEKILTSKAALEGERKQVTVLFADLKGSMELLADRDPEEARKILDPVLELMMEAVHRYEGTVNQVMGDGIMALFGAPLAHEDHAVRACYAALRMQDAARRYSDELRRAQGLEVQVRVGLNSGDVVVRTIGSDLRMDYSAVGQITNLAARMEQLAPPGTVRLTGETMRLAEGYVEVKSLGPIPVKGLPDPIEIFELTGAGTARTRLQVAALRGFTRFVGRTVELDEIRVALDRANVGHGQVVAVVGEPGVGKSRLFWELIHSHRVHGWLILQSASVSYGKATAYLPVIELLRSYFTIETRDDPRKIREKVTGKVLTLAPELGPTLPALLALLDVEADEASWQALDPRQRRQQTLDAVKRLLLRESAVQPLMVVFEDLHWIDGETQTLLDSLVESLPASRLMLLVNYRPEYSHAWGGKTYYRQLRIDPLLSESAEELLDALLGTDPALGPLKRLLVERTEANPLFLEESVRTLVETATLVGERGAYQLTRPVEGLQIPATVRAILAARIDRLAPEAKRLLQAAAVIGKDVPMPLLLAVADAPEHEVRAELTHLQAAEFLYETRLFPDLEYTFKHGLTHEVAYRSLLQERSRTLHGLITNAIERLYRDRLAEHVDRLGHHALRGELWEQAFIYLRQAATKASARSAYQDSVTALTDALTALDHCPASRDVLEKAVDVRLELWQSLAPLAEYRRILDCLREAEAAADKLGDPRRIGLIAAHLSHSCVAGGDLDSAVRYGARALEIATTLGDFGLGIMAQSRLGRAYYARGEYRNAVSVGSRLVALLEGDRAGENFGNAFPASVASRPWLVASLAECGDFAEALACGQQGLVIAQALSQPLALCVATFALGVAFLRRCDLDPAISLFKRGLELAETWDIRYWFVHLASALGEAYAISGRLAEAVPLLEAALARTGQPEFFGDHTLDMLRLGETYCLARRRDEAVVLAEQARVIAHRHKERGNEARALRLQGEIAAQLDPLDVDEAAARYRKALDLAVEAGMRPLVAHCHLGLGKLYRRTDKCAQAQEHLTTAGTMYRDMGMTYWLEKAEAEMRELG